MKLSQLHTLTILETWRSPTRVVKRIGVSKGQSYYHANTNSIEPEDYFVPEKPTKVIWKSGGKK